MKEKINVFDYSEQIMKALRRGILLNTNGDKFNSMVIIWGIFCYLLLKFVFEANPPLMSSSVSSVNCFLVRLVCPAKRLACCWMLFSKTLRA